MPATAFHRDGVTSELRCPGAKQWIRVPPLVTRFGVIPRAHNEGLFLFFFEGKCNTLIPSKKFFLLLFQATYLQLRIFMVVKYMHHGR